MVLDGLGSSYYRLFNLLFVGVAVRFVYAFGGGFHRYHLTMPLQLSVYW